MNAARVRLVAAAALIAALSGCGHSASKHPPDVSGLPLVNGAKVITRVQRCDKGANAYCAVQMVVVGSHFRTSIDLLKSEQDHLLKLGWSLVNGDTGSERAAESPGHKLRLTYATAYGDLTGIDLGWIKRAHPIALALSHTLFNQTSAMSMMLEVGPS